MALEVKWYDDEHTILIATIAKDTTWAEYHDAVDQIIKEASQATHGVYSIFYDDVGMPAGNPMPHLKQGITRMAKESNIKLFVIAGSRGSSGFVRAIIEAIGKMFMSSKPTSNGQGFGGFVKTLDEALKMIQADRAKSARIA